MVTSHHKPKFDPAAHLSKHGWKGKGTALKHGHSVRPLAVVQKKTLSGIGKDRDTAVPFWDHIFEATAASLFSSVASSPSGSPGPSSWAPPPSQVDSRGRLIPTPIEVKKKLSINATARAGREIARRGLYSKFLRGKVLAFEPDSESEPEEEKPEVFLTAKEESGNQAGPSRSTSPARSPPSESENVDSEPVKAKRKSKGKGKSKNIEESTEERKIRKAEKKAKRETKNEEVTIDGSVMLKGELDAKAEKKKRKRDKKENIKDPKKESKRKRTAYEEKASVDRRVKKKEKKPKIEKEAGLILV
ncbi:uncharacterized protein IL334_005117 [Kwoniella shivajii]|uniref:G-patch domain-containing protein n=1 Tax=Kwoniella shivajii TaxID=564305 RepID=A0ABZ1D671_9TREE|nr:hypothetical protein IL334_005117 [Kwoniella shivajii]